MDGSDLKLMRVGELAKAVGKTVRAMHLYEELGLLEPRARSEGGFRLYGPEAVARIHWIVKLQAIGFTLAEIQGFVKDFQNAKSAPEASARVLALFGEKRRQIRDQITQRFSPRVLDFWNPFAQADGRVKPEYGAGDGIHLNDAAHAILAQKVIDARVPEAVLSRVSN